MAWTKVLPVTGTNASQTPSFYQGNWQALQDFFDTEHYTFTSSLSGRHRMGIVGVMMEGATSAITAVSTSPGSGALAFDTTIGAWKMNGAADDERWHSIHVDLATTRVQAYASTESTATSSQTTIVPFNTEVVDSLSEYASASYVFSAAEAGYFYAKAAILVSTDTASGGDILSLILSGSAGVYRTSTRTTHTSAYSTIGIESIAQVASGGTLAFYLTAPANVTTTISGGAGNTFMRIHRIS